MSDGSQRVVLSGHTSFPAPAKSGVPQGSILSPLLYIVYVNMLASLNLSPAMSYLSDCSQRVLSSHISSPAPVKSGVPQGSILSPLLFIVYVNSLVSLNLSHVIR